MKINWLIVWEAAKEPLREIVMAIIPGVIAFLEPMHTWWAVILYLVIRGVDKYLYELGAATENPTLKKGITRF